MRSSKLDLNEKPYLMSLNGELCNLRDFPSHFAPWPCPISSALSVILIVFVGLIILRRNGTCALSGFIFFLHIYLPLLMSWIHVSVGILSLTRPMDMKWVAWLITVLTSLHFDNLTMNPNPKHSFAPCHFYGLKKINRKRLTTVF